MYDFLPRLFVSGMVLPLNLQPESPFQQITPLHLPHIKLAENPYGALHAMSSFIQNDELPALAFRPPDKDAIASHLQNGPSLPEGRHLHSSIVELGLTQDCFLSNLLISMYHHHGLLDDARTAFLRMDHRTVVSWNALLSAYSECENAEASLHLLQHMLQQGVEADPITFICVLSGCRGAQDLITGRFVYAYAIEVGLDGDVKLKNGLINMYSKSGALGDARAVFQAMQYRDVVSWTAMVTACSQHGHNEESLELFRLMERHGIEPNDVTFTSVLGACASHEAMESGRQIHASILTSGYESATLVMNALISMYNKCGSWQDSCLVFCTMHHQNIESWNSILCVFSQHGLCQKGLQLYEEMQQQMLEPNKVTFLAVLGLCTSPAALADGMAIHVHAIKAGLDGEVGVRSALITMYSKCGALKFARALFDNAHDLDLVLWTAIITAYAQHGYGAKALRLFEEMRSRGFEPSSVTFICILSACSHAGLANEGCLFFKIMVEDYKLAPGADHFSCIIDLLGKTGRLMEAASMIAKLLANPNATLWRSFLAASQVHGDAKQASWVAKHLLDAGPSDMAIYSLLSNVYLTRQN